MTMPDYERRITSLEQRVDFIDLHGTRGIDGLRLQLTTVDRDLGKLQGAVNTLSETVNKLRPQRAWPAIAAYIVTVIPLYALVISLVVKP
jgi:uncharacterized coiled-coil protein SlyX